MSGNFQRGKQFFGPDCDIFSCFAFCWQKLSKSVWKFPTRKTIFRSRLQHFARVAHFVYTHFRKVSQNFQREKQFIGQNCDIFLVFCILLTKTVENCLKISNAKFRKSLQKTKIYIINSKTFGHYQYLQQVLPTYCILKFPMIARRVILIAIACCMWLLDFLCVRAFDLLILMIPQ